MGKRRRTSTDNYLEDQKAWQKLREVFPKQIYDEIRQVLFHPGCNRGSSAPVYCTMYPYEWTRWSCSGRGYAESFMHSPRDIIAAIDNNWDTDSVISLHLCDTQTDKDNYLDVIYILKPAVSFRFKAWVLQALGSTLKHTRDADARVELKREIKRIKHVAIKVTKEIRHGVITDND